MTPQDELIGELRRQWEGLTSEATLAIAIATEQSRRAVIRLLRAEAEKHKRVGLSDKCVECRETWRWTGCGTRRTLDRLTSPELLDAISPK